MGLTTGKRPIGEPKMVNTGPLSKDDNWMNQVIECSDCAKQLKKHVMTKTESKAPHLLDLQPIKTLYIFSACIFIAQVLVSAIGRYYGRLIIIPPVSWMAFIICMLIPV